MLAVSRNPRLLVKTSMPARVESANLAFGTIGLKVSFEPLLPNIEKPSAQLGVAGRPGSAWYVMHPSGTGPEVNAWDLCHHVRQNGFGIVGVGEAELAEPDFEQHWVTGTPSQHALAITRRCQQAEPDRNLPAPQDPFWFRDQLHSQ